jgi:hypothetical protein
MGPRRLHSSGRINSRLREWAGGAPIPIERVGGATRPRPRPRSRDRRRQESAHQNYGTLLLSLPLVALLLASPQASISPMLAAGRPAGSLRHSGLVGVQPTKWSTKLRRQDEISLFTSHALVADY